MTQHHLLLHPAFRPSRQRFVAHLAQFFDHPSFRRIGSFTVTRGIFHHRQQAFYTGTHLRMAIQTLQQNLVAVSREHGGLLGRYPSVMRYYGACITLNHTQPAVLVDSLGRSTVNLRVYFWLNGHENSWLKVRSSVIRLVKLAFQKQGISMPDEAREVVFPQGIPVTLLDATPADALGAMPEKRRSTESPPEDLDAVSTKAEAGLYSEAVVIEEQARQVQPLKDGENLLPGTPNSAVSEKPTQEPTASRKGDRE